MADMSKLSVTLDAGELVAYCAMKQALEDIRDMRDRQPWEGNLEAAADMAREALETERRMTGGA